MLMSHFLPFKINESSQKKAWHQISQVPAHLSPNPVLVARAIIRNKISEFDNFDPKSLHEYHSISNHIK